MTARSTIAVLALGLATLGACGKKRDADKRPPSPAPEPPRRTPVAPPAPRLLPTFITLDEIRQRLPATPALRMTTEVALDASGKQGLGNGCVTATAAKVAMHQLADAYGVARWVIRTRETSQGDARGEFIGAFEVPDGTLHVRGVVANAPTCNPGELGLALYYSKVVPAPRVEPSAPAMPPAGGMTRPGVVPAPP